MKICRENIDWFMQELLNKEVDCPNDYSDPADGADHKRLITLGYVRGVLDLGMKLKHFLIEN